MRKLDINNRRYLGSKYKLLNFIEKTVNENCNDIKSVIDVFAGTGVVGDLFLKKMIDITSNRVQIKEDTPFYGAWVNGQLQIL